MKRFPGFAVIAALVASPAYADDRVELEPYTDWVLNYDDDSCALQRQFGPEGEQVYLEMRQFGPATDMQVTVASADYRFRRGRYEVAFEPVDPEPIEMELFDLRMPDDYEGKLFPYSFRAGPEYESAFREFVRSAPILSDEQLDLITRSMGLDMDSREFARIAQNGEFQTGSRRARSAFGQTEMFRTIREERESQVTGILIERAFGDGVFLRTGSLHAPMKAMRTCLDELLSHWGIDVEAHQSLTREVEPLDFEAWARKMQEDYPTRMLQQGYQGYVRTRLDVSAEGDVTGCHHQSQVSNEAFERSACNNLMRAEFRPALDANGEAIPSYYQIAVAYRFR